MLSFASCSVSLSFEAGVVGLGGCTGGQYTSVIPTVSGDITGNGDLSGIEIDIETTVAGGPTPQPISTTTTTDSSGHYSFELNGLNGDTGPHIICTQDCGGASYFPSGGTVQATVTSPDSHLSGQQSVCMASFTCNDLV
jgi:hypothetical protein